MARRRASRPRVLSSATGTKEQERAGGDSALDGHSGERPDGSMLGAVARETGQRRAEGTPVHELFEIRNRAEQRAYPHLSLPCPSGVDERGERSRPIQEQ